MTPLALATWLGWLLLASPDAGPAAAPSAAPPAAGAVPATRRPPAAPPPVALKNPVSITADKLQVLNKQNQAIYTGHVVAVRGTTRISCGRMVATYTAAQEISRIECTGGVEVEDRDRWARGDQAVFTTATGILEMTGSPEARQGPNTMAGDRVLFDLTRDTIEVEHPRAVFELSGRPPRAGKSRNPATAAPASSTDAGAAPKPP